MFSLASCGAKTGGEEGEVEVISIIIDTSTIPKNAIATQVDLSAIKLILKLSNNREQEIPLNEGMIFMADGDKLNKKGTHSISVIYEGMSAKFWITLLEPPIIKHMLYIVSGTRQGQEPIEGNWDGEIISGTRITIEAINRESEGYIFDYWAIGGQRINNNATFEYYVDDSVTIVATYKERLHKITFNSVGGSNIPQVLTREIEECPIPTKNEHVFIGWHNDDINQPVTFPYQVTRDTILRAVWEPLGLIYERRGSDNGYTVIGYNYQGTTPRTLLEIPETLGEGDSSNFVIRIARSAFEHATTIESISIPKSVISIDDYSFSNCVNLTQIKVDNDNANFKDNNGVLYNKSGNTLLVYPAGRMLENYVVENTLKIGNGAFYNANLGSIEIKSNIEDIGDYAFYSRTVSFIAFWGEAPTGMGYAESMFHDNLKEIFLFSLTAESGYRNSLSFKPYLSKIIADTNIPRIEIHDNLMYRIVSRMIGEIAEQSLEIISAQRNIESVIIPSHPVDDRKVTSIGAYAFSYCYELEEIEFPHNMHVNRILKGAFSNTKWQSNYIAEQVIEYGEDWSGLLIVNQMLMTCLEDRPVMKIPYTVTKICEASFIDLITLREIIFEEDRNNNKYTYEIHDSAFQNCINLTTITIPKQVKVLGKRAFENTALHNFSFEPDSELQIIGEYCFQNASKLTSFDIGENVLEIGQGAFNGCYSLERFTIIGNLNGINEYFRVRDGVLFEFDKNLFNDTDVFGRILHTYPAGRLDDIYIVPFESDIVGVTQILEYAFNYANIGAIILPRTIEVILPEAIIIPNLLFLQFTANEVKGTSYKDLFPEFGPRYIIISDNDNPNNYNRWWENGNILRASQLEGLNIDIGIIETIDNQKFLYQIEEGAICIIGGERAKAELKIPSQVTLGANSYPVRSISGYAFMGDVINSLILPSTIETIKAYAFYYCQSIMSITSERLQVPQLEYSQTDIILSFHPDTIIENALIYVPAGREQIYANAWPATINYILEIGTQLVVIFDAQGGSQPTLIDPQTGEACDLDTLDTIFDSPYTQKTGYEFIGWYDNIYFDGEAITFPYTKFKKVTLYARWQVRVFTITYQLDRGKFEDENHTSDSVNYDEFYSLPVPIKAGYNFIGWFDISEIAYTNNQGYSLSEWRNTANIELIAKWEKKEIVVTYDANGGHTTEPTTTVIYLSSSFTLEVPIRVGYSFLGWKDADDKYVTNNVGANINDWEYTEDITVKAVWQANQYTVNFDDGQGTPIPSVTVTYDETDYTFIIPQKENSVFFGWYNGIDGTGIQYTNDLGKGIRIWDIANNTTLYAQWPDDIVTLSDLNNIRQKLEGSFILKNDIIIDGEWEPIGIDNSAPFTGVLDGNGFSIYAMSISNIYSNYIGIIGYNQGIIRNLNVGIKYDKSNRAQRSKIDIFGDSDSENVYVGGLVGFNDITGIIINCKIAAEINLDIDIGEDACLYVGGIVGHNKGRIEQSYLLTEINTSLDEDISQPPKMYKGSLVGYHHPNAVIINCSFDVIVGQVDLGDYHPLGNYNQDRGGYFDTTGGIFEGAWE